MGGQGWFVNGAAVEDAPTLTLHDPAARWGDGVYDTQRVHRGRPLNDDLHLQRLLANARAFEVEVDEELVARTVAMALQAAAGFADAAVRSTVAVMHDGPPMIACLVTPWTEPTAADYARGIRMITSSVPHPATGAFGKTLSYGLFRIAARQAAQQAADDAWLCRDGVVVESTSAAVLWSEGDRWYRGDCTGAALRSTTLDALQRRGHEFTAADARLERLLSADQILLASGLQLVRGVAVWQHDESRRWQCTEPDAAASQMRAALLEPEQGCHDR
jgi:branched-chain amino acid aminotransferase